VYRIAGTALAAVTLGYEAQEAFPHEGTLYLVDDGGEIEPFAAQEDKRAPSASARQEQAAGRR
jgi:hypothetical protein